MILINYRKKLPEDIYKIFGMNKHLIMINDFIKKKLGVIWQVKIWYFWCAELHSSGNIPIK